MTGSPVCGPNVVDFGHAYNGCFNITGDAACGPNVNDMTHTYCNCYNLNGSPACGPNVTDMYATYWNCFNLKGPAVCGPNVTNMDSTYYNCWNLNGSPVCGPNVTDMRSAYYNCVNLTGSPVCGPNVASMDSTYYNCQNLTGSPVCGDKVTSMNYAYYNCRNLTGTPVIGSSVSDLSGIYINCVNLSGKVNMTLGTPNTYYMSDLFYGCDKLYGDFYIRSNNVGYFNAAFYRTNIANAGYVNVHVIPNSYTMNRIINTTNSECSIVGANITWTDAGTYYYNTAYKIAIYPYEPEPEYTVRDLEDSTYGFSLDADGYYESENKNVNNSYSICKVDFYNPKEQYIYVDCINYAESGSDYGILSKIGTSLTLDNNISEDITNKSIMQEFQHNSSSSIQTVCYGRVVAGSFYVKFIKDSSSSVGNDSFKFKVRFSDEPPITEQGYFILNSSSRYGFSLNSNGYYESENKGIHSSHSMCEAIISNPNNYNVVIDCVNSGESGRDYGILSKINMKLSNSDIADSGSVIQKAFNSGASTTESINYGPVSGSIQIKFRKDSSSNVGNDSLQFKIRFVDPNAPLESTYRIESLGTTYGFDLGSDGYYESNNKAKSNSYALCKVIIENHENKNVYIDCINYAESSYDYGILSKVGSTLTSSSSADSSDNVQKSFKGSSSSSVQTVAYGVVSGTIYIKYLKDGGVNSNNDSLKFKVRFE